MPVGMIWVHSGDFVWFPTLAPNYNQFSTQLSSSTQPFVAQERQNGGGGTKRKRSSSTGEEKIGTTKRKQEAEVDEGEEIRVKKKKKRRNDSAGVGEPHTRKRRLESEEDGNEIRMEKRQKRRTADDSDEGVVREKRRQEESPDEEVGQAKRRREKNLDDSDEESTTIAHATSRGRTAVTKSLQGNSVTEIEEWDPWPNQKFIRQYTIEYGIKSGNFQTWWSSTCQGTSKTGLPNAPTLSKARPSTRRCNGVIHCANPNRQTKNGCQYAIRPKTKLNKILEQYEDKNCPCGYQLEHYTCEVSMRILSWAGGYVVENSGEHLHIRPPNPSRNTQEAQDEFRELVLDNPTVKPLALSVGGSNRKPATEISTVFHNVQRVAHDRRKVLKASGTQPATNDIQVMEKLADFLRENGEMVRGKEIGDVMVFTIQNRTMRDFIIDVGAAYKQQGRVSGLQTDGAHKYWKLQTGVLICTSTYNTLLRSWVPVMFSYSNGTTASHYFHHFTCLFRSIREAQDTQEMEASDDDFEMVSSLHLESVS